MCNYFFASLSLLLITFFGNAACYILLYRDSFIALARFSLCGVAIGLHVALRQAVSQRYRGIR
ncbi:hypothetical protein ARC310_18245 [Pantoea ananatis]|nr:hypothetical protein KR94_15590 [Pantoea ananatis]PZD58633.1 hypothetical protein ARC310_18245 [Pantoea ananatis]PZD69057.1 hypothetical protein ARC311_05405 [Pantoea ananatis]